MLIILKNIAKKVLGRGAFFFGDKNDRFVFLFHDISEHSTPHHSDQYSTSPKKFYEIINYLTKKFEFTNIETILSRSSKSSAGKPLATITFDDGFYSVFQIAYPHLLKQKIPFTVFINKQAVCMNQIWFTNLILNKNDDKYWKKFYEGAIKKNSISLSELRQSEIWKIFRCIKEDVLGNLYDFVNIDSEKFGKVFCDINDLYEMKSSGLVSIHSHSTNHFILSECSTDLSYKELKENKLFVESITGKTDDHFAFPFGKANHFDLRVVEQCKDLSYKHVFSTIPNSFNIKNFENSQPKVVPRISIANQKIWEMKFMINMSIFNKRNS